jgi:hypothetical protein
VGKLMMNRVVVLVMLFLSAALHAMNDGYSGMYPVISDANQRNQMTLAFASINGQGPRLYPVVAEVHEQNYQILPDGEHGIAVRDDDRDNADRLSWLSERDRKHVADFSPELVSSACRELEKEADCQALVSTQPDGQRNNENKQLKRAMAEKLFVLLAKKEAAAVELQREKKDRYDTGSCLGCSAMIIGLAVAVVAEIVMFATYTRCPRCP